MPTTRDKQMGDVDSKLQFHSHLDLDGTGSCCLLESILSILLKK